MESCKLLEKANTKGTCQWSRCIIRLNCIARRRIFFTAFRLWPRTRCCACGRSRMEDLSAAIRRCPRLIACIFTRAGNMRIGGMRALLTDFPLSVSYPWPHSHENMNKLYLDVYYRGFCPRCFLPWSLGLLPSHAFPTTSFRRPNTVSTTFIIWRYFRRTSTLSGKQQVLSRMPARDQRTALYCVVLRLHG